MWGIDFEVDRVSLHFSPEKIYVNGFFQSQNNRKFHELSEYVIISQELWCFDDNIIKVPIPIIT